MKRNARIAVATGIGVKAGQVEQAGSPYGVSNEWNGQASQRTSGAAKNRANVIENIAVVVTASNGNLLRSAVNTAGYT